MNTFTKMTIGMLAGSLISVAALQTANAGTADAGIDSAQSVVVRYDSRALSSDDGARSLQRRLESAAREVCPGSSKRDVEVGAAVRACRSDAVARALRQISESRVAEIDRNGAKHG